MEQVDLCIQNVSIYNTVFQTFYLADVAILEGRIFDIDLKQEGRVRAKQMIDGTNRYMIPGLIDIHMHIESSMMTPRVFAEQLASCGVTTIVSEPHEMANVNGVQGVLDMIEAGKDTDIDIFYGIPSCVPSTSEKLETTGGIIDYEDMKQLLLHPRVVCVGEVMNYRQIIKENELEIGKFLKYLREQDKKIVVEGHCPALLDLDLSKFVFLGIDSDHTEHDMEELKQRFFNGVYVQLQGKMLKKEIFDFIHEKNLYGHFGFVTDDVMADVLWEDGHLDAIVRQAIKLGMKPEQAIYHATYTNAIRMGFTDRTMLTPGKLADFILVSDLDTLKIEASYKRGVCIFNRAEMNRKKTGSLPVTPDFSADYYHSIKLPNINKDYFRLLFESEHKKVWVRTARVCDGSTKTKMEEALFEIARGELKWENSSHLLAVVFERYGKTGSVQQVGNVGYGLMCGNLLKHGAVATTYAHDHHNLLVVGSNQEDMERAANCVIAMNGGIAVYDEGILQAKLQLNIGGILSDRPVEEIGMGLKQVVQALRNQGYRHYNPIMSLCTLGLLASPELKLSDRGLVDVKHSEIVSLAVPE